LAQIIDIEAAANSAAAAEMTCLQLVETGINEVPSEVNPTHCMAAVRVRKAW
jgi:hypothetical protein